MAKKIQRGLGALLGDAAEPEQVQSAPERAGEPVDEVRSLSIRLIDPNRDQPRRNRRRTAQRGPAKRWTRCACCPSA